VSILDEAIAELGTLDEQEAERAKMRARTKLLETLHHELSDEQWQALDFKEEDDVTLAVHRGKLRMVLSYGVVNGKEQIHAMIMRGDTPYSHIAAIQTGEIWRELVRAVARMDRFMADEEVRLAIAAAGQVASGMQELSQ
jgi:hypothetical protein